MRYAVIGSRYYYAHTLAGSLRPPENMTDYRLGDYAEASYFGPMQGPSGVWSTVNTSSSGYGRWGYGSGAPLALFDSEAHEPSTPMLVGKPSDSISLAAKQWLREPLGFELLLSGGYPSSQMPDVSPIALWKPIAPPGYSAIGTVISPGMVQPTRSTVRVLANECVGMCPAKQLWCATSAAGGRCAPTDGQNGGWSTAAYMAMPADKDGHEATKMVPMNLLWLVTNRTEIVNEVPCVRADCLASGHY